MKKVLVLLFCCLSFTGCLPAWKQKQLSFVDQFFQERSKGRDVKSFLCDSGASFTLSQIEDMKAPQSWKLVDDSDEPLVHREDRNNFTFKVESSDRSGQKVTNLWHFSLQPKNEKEEHPSDWCILSIDKK